MSDPKVTNELSRKEEQRGTRALMMWGVVIAAVIIVAVFAVLML